MKDPWHKWFSWHPVRTVDRRLVWGRMIWRRAKWYSPPTGACFWSWEYVRLDGYRDDTKARAHFFAD